ncbi:hypothetical protein [Kibdelosporangium aridum]|nr:hypothetical protein [Kibdelosporangium aridum]
MVTQPVPNRDVLIGREIGRWTLGGSLLGFVGGFGAGGVVGAL